MKTLITQVSQVLKTKNGKPGLTLEEATTIKNFIDEANKVSNGDAAQWDMEGNFLTNDWLNADFEKRDNIFFVESTKQIIIVENRKHSIFSIPSEITYFFPNVKTKRN